MTLKFEQVASSVEDILAKGGFRPEPLVAEGISRIILAVKKQFDALHTVNSNVSTLFLNKHAVRRLYWGGDSVVKKSPPKDILEALNLAFLELYHIEVCEMLGLRAIAFMDIEVLRQRGYFISNRKIQSQDLNEAPDFLPVTLPDSDEDSQQGDMQ